MVLQLPLTAQHCPPALRDTGSPKAKAKAVGHRPSVCV